MYGASMHGGPPAVNAEMSEDPQMLLSRLRECVREDTWVEYCNNVNSFYKNQVRAAGGDHPRARHPPPRPPRPPGNVP